MLLQKLLFTLPYDHLDAATRSELDATAIRCGKEIEKIRGEKD